MSKSRVTLIQRACLGLDLSPFFETYDRWKTEILNYFEAHQTSAAVEGVNNKARVITKRTYGLKSAESLWTRLILDLNRASEAIGWSIAQIRQMAHGLKSAKSLWDRLILDLNRASEAIGGSIEQIRQMAQGLTALFDPSRT